MKRIQLYCDGACRGNHRRVNVGGWGALLIWGEHERELFGADRNTTNNKMELTAVIEGLHAIRDKTVGVDVYVDSAYVMGGITNWIFSWIKKGWKNSKNEPVANKELWLELKTEKERFCDITFNKVKGHCGIEGNERADALANKAMDELELTGS